jgi:hypothetical protein
MSGKSTAKQPRGKREISPDSAVARVADLAKSVAKTRRITPANSLLKNPKI